MDNTQQTKETSIVAPSGVQIHDSNHRAAAERGLRTQKKALDARTRSYTAEQGLRTQNKALDRRSRPYTAEQGLRKQINILDRRTRP